MFTGQFAENETNEINFREIPLVFNISFWKQIWKFKYYICYIIHSVACWSDDTDTIFHVSFYWLINVVYFDKFAFLLVLEYELFILEFFELFKPGIICYGKLLTANCFEVEYNNKSNITIEVT